MSATPAGHGRILTLYVVPSIMATVIILATIGLGTVILAESALSFRGFGVPPPYPSWGDAVGRRAHVHGSRTVDGAGRRQARSIRRKIARLIGVTAITAAANTMGAAGSPTTSRTRPAAGCIAAIVT